MSSMNKTIQIPVAEITEGLKNGFSDAELMKKHGLSEKGLKTLFDRLLKAVSNGSRQIEVEVKE